MDRVIDFDRLSLTFRLLRNPMAQQVKSFLFISIFLIGSCVYAQNRLVVTGKITDSQGIPLVPTDIVIPGTSHGTSTTDGGKYTLVIPRNDTIELAYSFIGYKTQIIKKALPLNDTITIDVILEVKLSELDEVSVQGERDRDFSFEKLNMKEVKIIPTVSGSVESYLVTLPGVTSSNELSSQYSVRGGNFDENLIYINDIEVYKPYLIRSGTQEGLSIVNPDLASSVQFSAGGYNASYGDKMSSVLDIKYKKPTRFGGGFDLSFLGGSFYLGGTSKNSRLTYIAGIRYKSNQYLIKSLDVTGDYKPRFGDFQTYITYQLNKKWWLDFLGNISINHYNFYPEDRTTSFGTISTAVQLNVLFNGWESDKFNTYLGALSATYRPSDKVSLTFIGSAFRTNEKETFDIEGFYSLNELDKQIGSESMGDSIMNIGVGRFIDHARNYFTANVIAFKHTGNLAIDSQSSLLWGLKFQNEAIDNQMNEWKMVDSAGYSIPYTGTDISLAYTMNADNQLNSNRLTSFVLYNRDFNLKNVDLELDAGIRTNYWSFNNQFLVSPRLSVLLDPGWKRDFKFRFATGFYYQPPFYKEIVDQNGEINEDIRAQKSTHFLVGSIWNFKAWNRPFQFSSNVYYKNLQHLISYKIDNVRIIYSGKNNAKGYAAGIDFNISGEFVKGVESWASLSLLQTREKLTDGSESEGSNEYYPRPTDRLLNFSLFFQDYFPRNPTFKVYMSLHFGTGLPTSPPTEESGANYFRMPPYRRFDIGISKILKDENSVIGDKGLFKSFRTAWISFEVFNLLGINNTISYTWISTVNNLSGEVGQFAVPNYLTSRRINLKLTATF